MICVSPVIAQLAKRRGWEQTPLTVQKSASSNGHFISLQLPKDKAWSSRKYTFILSLFPLQVRAQPGNVN